MKWKVKENEFIKTYPGYELIDDHTIIEHDGNIIHATNKSIPKVYKKSDDIIFYVNEIIGDKKIKWKLFISFDELKPLLTEHDSYKSHEQGNAIVRGPEARAYVNSIRSSRTDPGGPSNLLSY